MKGLPHQRELQTKMVSKSENRQHRNRSRSSTEQVASWQDHAIGDFNRSTRFFSFCEDKAWILKKRDMTQVLISSKYQCKEWSSCWKAWSKTSSNGKV